MLVLKIGIKARISVLTSFIEHSARSSSRYRKERKGKERHTHKKGGSKTVRSKDDMIVYIENQSTYTKLE